MQGLDSSMHQPKRSFYLNEIVRLENVGKGTITRVLNIIGEAAKQVSQETRDKHVEVPWSGIIGFRNGLAQEYGAIYYQRLHTVLIEGVPKLIIHLKKILNSISKTK